MDTYTVISHVDLSFEIFAEARDAPKLDSDSHFAYATMKFTTRSEFKLSTASSNEKVKELVK